MLEEIRALGVAHWTYLGAELLSSLRCEVNDRMGLASLIAVQPSLRLLFISQTSSSFSSSYIIWNHSSRAEGVRLSSLALLIARDRIAKTRTVSPFL